MNELSKRLQVIASFVPKGKSVCDVGTDHGYLPAALCLSGDFTSVTATDIGEKPLQNARKNIEKLGADGVELILCDGLSAVPREKAETVIIAGMGGDVISGIIKRCPYKEKSLFILQPMTGALTLREYLAENGFAVKSETATSENKKVYSVMVCEFDGVKRCLTEAQKRIGELTPTTKENRDYIEKQLRIVEKCIKDLESSGKNPGFLKENLMAKQEISKIKEG